MGHLSCVALGGKWGPLRGIRKPHDKWFTAHSSLKMEIVDKQWNVVSLLTKMTVPVCQGNPRLRFHFTALSAHDDISLPKQPSVCSFGTSEVTFGAAERHLSLLINGNLHYSTWVFSFMALPSPFPDCGYDLLWKTVLKGQVYFSSFHNKPSGKALEHLRLFF